MTEPLAGQVGSSPTADAVKGAGVKGFFADNAWAVGAAAIATVVVELGVFAVAKAWQMPSLHVALASLAACVLWVVLATPILAASGRTALGALVRGGIVADASCVTVLVLWACCDEITILAALETYCILAAVTLAAVAVTRLARTPAGRYTWAVLASAVMLAVLAGPFWIGGPIRTAPYAVAENTVAAAVYANPFYAVTACLTESSRFVWHQNAVLYRVSRIGDYGSAPPLLWYPAVLIHLSVAGILAAVAALFGAVRRRHAT